MCRCTSLRFKSCCILAVLSVSCLYIADISTGNRPEGSTGGVSMSAIYAGVHSDSACLWAHASPPDSGAYDKSSRCVSEAMPVSGNSFSTPARDPPVYVDAVSPLEIGRSRALYLLDLLEENLPANFRNDPNLLFHQKSMNKELTC